MNIKDFFSFSSKLVNSTFLAGPMNLKTDENGISEHLKLIKGDYKGIDFPVFFKQEDGKNLTDILDTGWAGFFLISERMKIILEENTLTGWKVFPIKLFDKKMKEISGYHGFSIIGRCGPINYEKAEIIEKTINTTGRTSKYYKGLYIDLSLWDKTDFFSPDRNYRTIITRKAADMLKKNKLSNLRMENLAEYETDITNILR